MEIKLVDAAVILKAGDVVVLECTRPLSDQQMKRVMEAVSAATKVAGIKAIVLPEYIRVARVEKEKAGD